MKRILTGDRPTSDSFHLGNYIGSLKNRVKLQDEYETFILIADLHALTTHFDKTADLKKNILGLMLGYLSVGLDPNKVHFCLQSQLPQTTQLAYFLSLLTQRAVLERQPALKEKLTQGNQDSLGLYYYPVLQAADILLPKANLVPVGKDQKAHIEFARDIAIKFNNLYGDIFPIPEPLIGEVPTLPGTDGQSKMGKSLGNAIFLTDTAAEVEKKVMSMYTDPQRVHATDPGRVEDNPVFIYLNAFCTEADLSKVTNYQNQYRQGQVGDIEVKKYLIEIFHNFLKPIRQKRAEYEKQPELVEQILLQGTEKARAEAEKTLTVVKKAMKLNYFDMASSDQQKPQHISLEKFLETELKIGTVLTAEAVADSDKLLKLTIDLGEKQPRQILAGVRQYYSPEDFVGQQVVIVANLEPRVMRGLESQGMMLAADSQEGPVFLTTAKKVPPGSNIR